MKDIIQSCKRSFKNSVFKKKQWVDMTPIKVPVKHQGKTRWIRAKRG